MPACSWTKAANSISALRRQGDGKVEVNASEVAVETTNATLGQVITSQQVAELPLNGRDFRAAGDFDAGHDARNQPGSFFNGGPSSEVSARGSFSLSVGGSRASSTDWLLDGNDNNELTAGGIAILPSIDAIQEFKVLTYNYSAEYGTRAGPTVLVTTKSGSNQFHGSLFEFFRNTDLDARSYFASHQRTIQSESVRRRGGWCDQERQDFLLPRLPGQAAAARNSRSWVWCPRRRCELEITASIRMVGQLERPTAAPTDSLYIRVQHALASMRRRLAIRFRPARRRHSWRSNPATSSLRT